MLLTLSENYVEGGAQNTSGFEPVSGVLLAIREWTDALGPSVIFAMSALILYTALYRSQLVPRWLSLWGLIGASLLLVAGTLALYGESPTSTISIALAAPIGIQEMVLAGWLIVKGFSDGDVNPRRSMSEPKPAVRAVRPDRETSGCLAHVAVMPMISPAARPPTTSSGKCAPT